MTRIVHRLPDTHYEHPDSRELKALLAAVETAQPWLAGKANVSEVARAMVGANCLRRRDQPNSAHAFSGFLDFVNMLLRTRLDWDEISGPALMVAPLASGDFDWIQQDQAIGQPLELYADPHSGRPCAVPNAWRRVVEIGAAAVRRPRPPRLEQVQRAPVNQPRVYADGRLLGPHETLWTRP